MTRKKLNQILAKEAAKLPVEYYTVYHKEWITENEEGEKLETPYLIGVPQEHVVSHKRRIRKLWENTKSVLALAEYFAKRGFELHTT